MKSFFPFNRRLFFVLLAAISLAVMGCSKKAEIRGIVTDMNGGAPIAGAEVNVLDADGEEASDPVITDETGEFVLKVDEFGKDKDVPLVYTLNVTAEGYFPYPDAMRPAQLLDMALAQTVKEGAKEIRVYENERTQIRLIRKVVIRGMVLDMADDSPIEGALVQPVDVNGIPVGSTAITDANGNYELFVPQVWDLDGNLDAKQTIDYGAFMLRCQSMGYQEFPTAFRPSLPIDMQTAVQQQPADGQTVGELLIDESISSLTIIKLIALQGDTSQLGSISGNVLSESRAGALVLAINATTQEAFTGFSGFDGQYMIFNIPPGTYRVEGYGLGIQLVPVEPVAMGAAEQHTGVDLAESANPLNTVSGNVQIVNAPGGSLTSVVLAVESTFNETAARGVVPPGLRVAGVSGDFSISNVPDGRYVVLAAFENDNLVRDPDSNISGTQIVHLEVPGTGGVNSIVIPDGFKVTEALGVVGPGADMPEAVNTLTPTLQWADDSSEDNFEIWVYDSFGTEMWNTVIPGVSGSEVVSKNYAGTPLQAGMYYQFKVKSIRKTSYISATEDLRGVFYYAP